MRKGSLRHGSVACVLTGLLQACQAPMPAPDVTSGPTQPSSPSAPADGQEDGQSAALPPLTAEAPEAPEDDQSAALPLVSPDERWPGSRSQPVLRASPTGTLPFVDLNEASGLTASGRAANRLWAINDSGNPSMLYAMTRDGHAVDQWSVDVPNRDWEALASLRLNGEPYLLIADIGDNLKRYEHYDLHLIREPELDGRKPTTLTPDWTIRFHYEDGPHNAEALSVVDGEILIITKEPISPTGPVPGGIYTLPLPSVQSLSSLSSTDTHTLHVAKRAGTMTPAAVNFEARLAARLASVDLNHITALEVDQRNNRLWVLTYRNVVLFDRAPDTTWAQALTLEGQRVHAHSLAQAESLAITADSLVWFTSEGTHSALWALPP